MLAHSPRDRSRSPHNTNGTSAMNTTSNQNECTSNNKARKENEAQQRMRNLKVSQSKKHSLILLFSDLVIYSNFNQ